MNAHGNILTPGDVAQLFGVDPKTVIRWAKKGQLPAFRTPGGHHRFHRSDITPLLTPTAGRPA